MDNECIANWLKNIKEKYIHGGDEALDTTRKLAIDIAIERLRKQHPMKPHYTTLKYIVDGKECSVKHPECPKCVENKLFLWDAEIEKGQAFCKRCGQAIDWKDGEQE